MVEGLLGVERLDFIGIDVLRVFLDGEATEERALVAPRSAEDHAATERLADSVLAAHDTRFAWPSAVDISKEIGPLSFFCSGKAEGQRTQGP